MRAGFRVVSLVAVQLIVACATKPQPIADSTPVPAPAPQPQVQKLREPLEVTPLELHFSGMRGVAKAEESVAVKNSSNEEVQVAELRIVGTHAGTFRIARAPAMPVLLRPGAVFSFAVGFSPPADAEPGVHHARVRLVRGQDDDGPPCDLTALVSKGQQPADEPSLQQVMEALGYDVDVGSPALILRPHGGGDAIRATTFERAKEGNVGLYLVARYGSNQASKFGYFVVQDGKPTIKAMGGAASGSQQTLNPELEGEAQTSFDPGQTRFGLYLKVGKHAYYTDDTAEPKAPKAASRVYPLRSRGRTLVPDAYVVAFDEDGNGDFQDHVFLLWNVKPAPLAEDAGAPGGRR